MPNKHSLRLVILLLLAAGFGWGVTQLFLLRFGRGDVYPPYSSLRTDPLGARVLYEALAAIPGTTVERQLDPLSQLCATPDAALIFAGSRPPAVTGRALPDSVARFVARGGRLVIALFPLTRASRLGRRAISASRDPTQGKEDGDKDSEGDGEDEDAAPNADEPETARTASTAAERWGFSIEISRAAAAQDDADGLPMWPAHCVLSGHGLPETLPWHSTAYFKTTHTAWRTVYAVNDQPVVIERPFGKGSVLLASDAYLLSNEALRRTRRPRWLVWLLDGRSHVVFDETHLGIARQPGIMSLARQYRLHGALAGFLAAACLFVWYSLTPLVRRPTSESAGEAITIGRDSRAGLVNLLRRSVPRHELLETCLAQWEEDLAGRDPTDKAARLRHEVAASERRDPVAVYCRLCAIASERNRRT